MGEVVALKDVAPLTPATPIPATDLLVFVRESNRIEGITREPLGLEIDAHLKLLAQSEVWLQDLETFAGTVQAGAQIRGRGGMNVSVGNHIPPPGGMGVVMGLMELIDEVAIGADPHAIHVRFETLHPFTDGNGRTGRALWLWQMVRQLNDRRAFRDGFLQRFYYQTLDRSDGR